ncbi:MAG: Pyrimidine dimer DNA glycosylase [Firmicutes bacterium ADurb.Bin506]|nr:MAG: Pyrimidine dimer DNA glycosylase [Firmicutes bacterium ADurb.Bin506]
MTRINAGIPVEELCDQHLLAEYRELPRMVKFARTVKDVPDVDFCLNTGHMKSVVRYGAYLVGRHHQLIAEMRRRGFDPLMPPLQYKDFTSRFSHYPSQAWLALAVHVLRPRIVDRLSSMKREPTWTKSTRPDWTAGSRL